MTHWKSRGGLRDRHGVNLDRRNWSREWGWIVQVRFKVCDQFGRQALGSLAAVLSETKGRALSEDIAHQSNPGRAMSDIKEEWQKPSLKDLILEQKPRDEIELEGHQFEVIPVTVGVMKKLSAPGAQDVLDRDVGLQALRETINSGGKRATDVLLDALSEASKQQLAKTALASNGFAGGGSDALAELGATLKDRKNLFAMPESLNIGCGRW
ncbi:MAG: hypothetical protein WAW12_06050 [Pseudomonas sp.]